MKWHTLLPLLTLALGLGGDLQAQSVEFGNISVVQNDSGNAATSVTLTRAPGSSQNFTILGGNRGDYDVSFGSANDVTSGVMLSAVSQNGRDNAVGGDTIGLFYATSATDFVGSANTGRYWIPIFRTAQGDEVNINVACAWFPYNQWLGGFARNGAGTNGGANDTLTASAGINLGTQFVDNGGGLSTLNLTTLGGSSASGILLVNGAKNEDNYALSRANTDGTFTIWCHDNGANGGSYEQDHVAFVYLPVAAVGTKRLVAIGRVNSNATTDLQAGTFTLTKGGTGQWYLSIAGHSNTSGVLLVSPEGGGTNTSDNVVSYQWDGTNNRWVIESRDLSGATVQPTLQDGASGTEDVFSFAFFSAPGVPVASITAPAPGSSYVSPGAFAVEATATVIGGSITQVEFLRNGVVVATDNSEPYTYQETNLPAGFYNLVARASATTGEVATSSPISVTVTLPPGNLPPNTALRFDGVNDYVTMGVAPELNAGGPPSNGLTLECWFRKEGTGINSSSGSGGVSGVPLFGKGRGESDGSNVDCGYFFGINSAGLLVADFETYPATGLTSGQNYPITASNSPIQNYVWNHAAVTYDGNSQTWIMYLNGVQVGTATAAAGALPRYDTIQHFGIGAAFNSSGVAEGAFAGMIDEVRVWNYARSGAEIAAGMGQEIGAALGLIGRFGLNEGTGFVASSSTGATIGTLTNGPIWVDGAPFTTANAAPLVSLTSPVNGATSIIPLPVSFEATASDIGGSVSKVEFRVDGIKVGEDLTEPYSLPWTPPAVGSYTITARAIDNLGASTVSPSITLSIVPNPNQPPVISAALPVDGASIAASFVSLAANVSDPESDAMTVTFYGRQTTPPAPGPDFSIIAIPDTQYYSEGSTAHATTVTVEQLIATFGAQTQWVIDNKATRNIAFVSHMGDIVEHGNNGGDDIEWQRASAAMGRLENPAAAMRAYGIPYGLAPGNHDEDPIGVYDSGSTAFYNQYFGISRFSGRGYWGGNFGLDNTNNFQLFSASGLDFIAIHMAYDTSPNQPILDWADALLKAYPHRRAIVTSHWIVNGGNPATFSAQGQAIYENLKDNPNLFLMLCGHIHAEGRRMDVFQGRTVHSILQDYQGTTNGGNGFFRIYTFSPVNNRITVESYSPTLGRAVNASDAIPSWSAAFDLPYDMQTAVSDWVPLATVNVPSGGSSASTVWNGLEAGKHYEWYAAVTDGVSAVGSNSRRFSTVAGTPPTATLQTPLEGATFSTPASISLSATASSSEGTVARVEFYANGTKVGEDISEPYSVTWAGAQPGAYALTAVAVGSNGLASLSNVANVTVAFGDFPPTVSLTSPVDGAVYPAPANVTLVANASDVEGAVTKVEFYSGTTLLGEDLVAPFEFPVTNLGAGSYVFSAKATDGAGQVVTSASVTISAFVEASAPNTGNVSAGTFDLPAWTVIQTSAVPKNFSLPGSDAGDLELRINDVSVPFGSGITLAANWHSPGTIAAGTTSRDNLCQPYANVSGSTFVSVLDNSNNNAPGANPTTSEQSAGLSVAFLRYADGWTGASVNSGGTVTSGNLPAGVTVAKEGGAGTYSISGLATAGNLLAFTNGDSGTLADNVVSVRVENGRWVMDTRDNAGGGQDNDFSFVYIPPATTGVYAGAISPTGVVSSTNASLTSLGVTVTVNSAYYEITFGDGTVINPTTATIFAVGDSTIGGSSSTAVDNLISWTANGNSFRIFTQDLPEIDDTFEPIALRFVAIPFSPVAEPNVVTIQATDGSAGEFGSDQVLSFSVSRTGDTSSALIVPLSFSGSATAGGDYAGQQNSVTIPATMSSVSLSLTVNADAFAEGTETVTVEIASGPGFTIGVPGSATGSIADRPVQAWYVANISDPLGRQAGADVDRDGRTNAIEYFSGTMPESAASAAITSAQKVGNSVVFRFSSALNRPDVTGVVEWSTDLVNWYRSGESNGATILNISETTNSQPNDDPQIIDAIATAESGTLPLRLYLRLKVTE